jgi:hypothetical protein
MFHHYPVNGCTAQYTGRKTWTMRLFRNWRQIDELPVTWLDHIYEREGKFYVPVYYPANSRARAEALMRCGTSEDDLHYQPFVVAICTAINGDTMPRRFNRKRGVVDLFLVRATGTILGPRSIESQILQTTVCP